MDFPQYDAQVEASTSKSGNFCPDAIRSMNQYIEGQLSSSSTANSFKALFNATSLTNQEFLFYVSDTMASMVQYGDRTGLCDGLKDKSME